MLTDGDSSEFNNALIFLRVNTSESSTTSQTEEITWTFRPLQFKVRLEHITDFLFLYLPTSEAYLYGVTPKQGTKPNEHIAFGYDRSW